MAAYRQIHTEYWGDEWVLGLDPEDKLLFVFLFSNDRSSLIGLYDIALKLMMVYTGLSEERILEGLGRFAKAGKAYYEDGHIWVPKLLERNAANLASPKIQAHIRKLIFSIPNIPLKTRWIEYFNYNIAPRYGISTIDIISSPPIGYLHEHEHEQEHEQELEQEHEDPIASASADADNPAPADKTPTTFAQWLEYLEPSKNRQALVRRMIEIFYPGHDPPDYGYIVKVAKKLGRGINGYRRLMELLWRQHTDPPKGDILPYIMAIAKKDSATARHLHDHKGDPPAPLPPVEDDRTEEEKRLDTVWDRALDELCSGNLGRTAVNTYLHNSYLIEQTPERAVIVVHDELSSWLETDGWQHQIRQALGMNPDAMIAFEVETEAEQ